MPWAAYAIIVGLDTTPRSYNEMLAATQAVHRHAQYHEMPLLDALRIAAILLRDRGAADKLEGAMG